MGDQEDEDFKKAVKMSMQQHEPPEPKRSKPRENAAGAVSGEESPELKNRRLQRELMAAAAERRMRETKKNAAAAAGSSSKVAAVKRSDSDAREEKSVGGGGGVGAELREGGDECAGKGMDLGEELSLEVANELFSMVFGGEVTKDILLQWSNQGIRFSPDPETSMGLVQHEGGPCGVLATIQGFVLKYLLFFSEELSKVTPGMQQNLGPKRLPKIENAASNDLASFTEERKSRALVRSMCEILFSCGSDKSAVIATLNIPYYDMGSSDNNSKDEIILKALEGISIESGFDLHKLLRVNTFTSQVDTLQRLEAMLPVFRSRLGALLFLISALLSRGLDSVQDDRDDQSQSLVTAPFGHASQEIVNLLLCGQAVANVFDGRMDLGGGMFLKGISTTVEVGFVTLLESLNFCKVGQYLKRPKWPIWVVGSESHYTVLFALDTSVQDENELERREAVIRRAFDAQDQSGGGGFISVEGFHQVLKEMSINLPTEKLDHLCSTGFIVWSEFWQVLLDLDKSSGGLKDSTGLMGKKVFNIYHFNGIAKSVLNGMPAPHGCENPVQRPRLTKLRVSVPPRWTPEEFMADVVVSGPKCDSEKETGEAAKPEPSQHAPLVDCIRTRWPRASCNWEGDPPSIV